MPRRRPPTGDPILDALKAERERRGLTLQGLAEKIDRQTYQSIWQWESGASDPTLSSLREWAGAFGFTVALVVGVDPMTQRSRGQGVPRAGNRKFAATAVDRTDMDGVTERA
ncbi:helix-turn-helix transcriptional regulator [Dactylosporangium roseum]|uniref:Helix-turn-helix transcriptional regulator n=1 Tax=Dactylosporangium roseum TaxID=47989 RepID=A0ABY5Z927_9ACTN|nr:helix-turn-helix transcriptional regulator [Dactylosporangium roseum]UWZ37515.1 helix-turn-helix transcriptional regulator [Dactylosporangium roseum]